MNNKVSRRVLARTVAAKLLAEPKNSGHWLKVTAAYLIENKMAENVDLVVNDIARELYAQSGHLLASVTSARKLAESAKTELTSMLKSTTGAKHVELTQHVDPDLLGGLVVRTPDQQLDISVRTKLKQLATI